MKKYIIKQKGADIDHLLENDFLLNVNSFDYGKWKNKDRFFHFLNSQLSESTEHVFVRGILSNEIENFFNYTSGLVSETKKIIYPKLVFFCDELEGCVGASFNEIFEIHLLRINQITDDSITKEVHKITNFKYEIDLDTPLGTIQKRYFMEYKNRNGGDCNGDYYIMYNGRSYSQSFIDASISSLDKKDNK